MKAYLKEKIKAILLKYKIGAKFYFFYTKLFLNEEQKERYHLSSRKKFSCLKNTKNGKRCFIIGNGPSLTISDLNCLKNEDTFAVNRIYKIFDQTEFRPTYYCIQDPRMVEELSGEIEPILNICKYVFLNSNIKKLKKEIERDNLFYMFLYNKPYNDDLPEFSEDLCKGIFEGYTVAYACIQIAVYMGYSEIYLLGMDHNYYFTACEDGSAVQDDPAKNYMKGLEGKMVYAPKLDKSTLAYRRAALFCKERNIIIKNATRGGKLEEFERIDFDDLF